MRICLTSTQKQVYNQGTLGSKCRVARETIHAICERSRAMAKAKRTIWDELIEIGKEIMDKVDEALSPPKKPVPVPIPVRNNPRPYPYDQRRNR